MLRKHSQQSIGVGMNADLEHKTSANQTNNYSIEKVASPAVKLRHGKFILQNILLISVFGRHSRCKQDSFSHRNLTSNPKPRKLQPVPKYRAQKPSYLRHF